MSKPRFIDIEQGSPEWHDLRRKHRMASLAPAVMGECPYQTRGDVLRFYRGEERAYDADAPPLRWGRAHETDARQAAAAETGQLIHPMVAINGEYGASLDGVILEDNGEPSLVVECKAPWKCEDSTTWKLAIAGDLGHYKWQVQHQLMVTGAPAALFLVWTPRVSTIVIVKPDLALQERLRVAWDALMAEVDATEERTDEAWSFAADLWRHKIRELKDAEKGVEEARNALLALADKGMRRTRGAGVVLQRSEVRGNVDYARIPELKGVDLDQYRKPSTERVTLTEEKKE